MSEEEIQNNKISKKVLLSVFVAVFDLLVVVVFLASIFAADKPDKAVVKEGKEIKVYAAKMDKKIENGSVAISISVSATPSAALTNSPRIEKLKTSAPAIPNAKPTDTEKITVEKTVDLKSPKTTENIHDTDEEQPNLTEWVADKLIPGNQEIKEQKETKSWIGWIFDRDCIGINPYRHTKECNLMGTCIDSGLGIVEYIPGKDYNTYKSVDCFKAFDVDGRDIAITFLKELPDNWKTNVTVKVTGYIVDNIPVNIDESVVPEFDASKVDHFISGIHILSIEAAYIDGLSTNELPEPNLVYPK